MVLSIGVDAGLYGPYYDLSGDLAFKEGLLLRGYPIGREWAYGTSIIHDFPHYGYYQHFGHYRRK
jgi:hypothetical protein